MNSFSWKWNLSDLETPNDEAPTVFSCFACGGGSSMGYKRAGFNVLGNCEIDPKIADVYKRNLHPKYSYIMDIRDFNNVNDLPDELMNLDVLDGSPPCSTFSMQGDREKAWGKKKKFAEGQQLQTLDDLFFVFIDTVAKLKPKVVVAENVTGLIKGNSRGYVNEIIKKFHNIGYAVQIFVLDSSFMDVPQKRERVFFIANRIKAKKLILNFNNDPILFKEVRSKNGDKTNSKAENIIKMYGTKKDNDCGRISKRVNGKTWGFSFRICHDDKVAPTVTTIAPLRFCDKTTCTAEDIINVSSFPQDYDFGTNARKKDITFICGMSVPPNMMAHIASEIRRQWLD